MNKTSRIIANALKRIDSTQGDEVFRTAVRRGVELSAHALSEALAREYPIFEKSTFLRSCGVSAQIAQHTPLDTPDPIKEIADSLESIANALNGEGCTEEDDMLSRQLAGLASNLRRHRPQRKQRK